MEQILKPLSKDAADIVRRYSTKIADFLDELTSIGEALLTSGFRNLGMPADVAKSLAQIIMSLI